MTNPEDDLRHADDELVAYLDGELTPEESRAIEARMAADPAVRRRLNELEQTWDVLDVLPRGEPTEVFTRSTIELVLGDAVRRRSGTRRWWIRRAVAAALMGLVPLALGAGAFFLVRHFQTRSIRELERDLPVIQNMDVYLRVPGLRFLEELEQSGAFSGEATDDRK